jgi:hypothetical protein
LLLGIYGEQELKKIQHVRKCCFPGYVIRTPGKGKPTRKSEADGTLLAEHALKK